MKLNGSRQANPREGLSAFSLVETAVGVAILGIVLVTLYTGLSSGFGLIQLAREHQRATQILSEKFETVRLYSWDQINTSGFIPQTFSAPFCAVGTNTNQSGIVYHGKVEISPAPLSESYQGNVKLVKITLTWTSGQLKRQREMQSFVARYGLQNYIY